MFDNEKYEIAVIAGYRGFVKACKKVGLHSDDNAHKLAVNYVREAYGTLGLEMLLDYMLAVATPNHIGKP